MHVRFGTSKFSPRSGGMTSWGVAGCAIAGFIAQGNWLLANLLLPQISAEFRTAVTDLQWVLTSFMLGFGSLLAITGRLADTHGRRKTSLVGLLLLAASSSWCAVAPSAVWLLVGRTGQGIAAAVVAPAVVSLVSAHSKRDTKNWRTSVVLAASGAGVALGPVLGSVCDWLWGWRAVFWVGAVLSMASAAMVLAFTGEQPRSAARLQLPLMRALLIPSGAASLTLAFDRGTAWGWRSFPVLGLFLVGLCCLAGFAFGERRTGDTLYDRSLYRDRRMHALFLSGTMSTASYVVIAFFAAFFLTYMFHMGPAAAGTAFLPLSLSNAMAVYFGGRIYRRNHVFTSVAILMVISGGAILWLSEASTVAAWVAAFTVLGASTGTVSGLVGIGVQRNADETMLGSAAGALMAARTLAGSVLLAAAATGVEFWHGGTAGAGTDFAAMDRMMQVTALMSMIGAAVMLTYSYHFRRRALGPGYGN